MKLHFGPLGFFLALFCLGSASAQTNPTPLIHAHAHNDYLHARPLQDALERGFCSVEADIHLIGGQLLVAHDREKAVPAQTLQSLYLEPLRERVRRNGGGVFAKGIPFTLLIDIKSEAEPTYAVLRHVLKEYTDLLTVFRPDATETRPVTIILSGNRPQALVEKEPVRYAAIDGRLPDLSTNQPRHLIPLISDKWTQTFQWRGVGSLPDEERSKLREIVARAHEQGRRVRFWAVPDISEAWRELRLAGVDLINTDRLDGLQKFFLEQQRGQGTNPISNHGN